MYAIDNKYLTLYVLFYTVLFTRIQFSMSLVETRNYNTTYCNCKYCYFNRFCKTTTTTSNNNINNNNNNNSNNNNNNNNNNNSISNNNNNNKFKLLVE